MTATAVEPPPFDPCEALPVGITVLEASAGTGKTHAVASLVVAEVARGRPLEDLLVVTFTRKATGTLRERIWQRLTDAVDALDPGVAKATDELHAVLATGTPEEVAIRRSRLRHALSSFDSATIATTHGFCQQVLASLGVAGDAERELEVTEDIGNLVDEAVDDLFVRRFHAGEERTLELTAAMSIARKVIANPDATIAAVDRANAEAVLRRRFAVTLRDRIVDQKRCGRLATFDDLLSRLAASIDDPVRGEVVVERLRRRFSMVVVDEFQDTDTVQWHILRAAFGTPPCRLVLVGDPKQAIYAFRGGDVHAYIQATQGANERGLDVTWRADGPLLDALDAFFHGAQLGAETIRHRPLRVRPGAEASRLLGPAVGAPLTIKIVERSLGEVALSKQGVVLKPAARRFIARDVAAEAVRMLSSGTTIVERDEHGAADAGRPLRPGDMAVLVRSHNDARTVCDALHDFEVPAVVHGGSSVMATAAAGRWLDLLRVLEQPASTTRLRVVALGPFVGLDATRMALAEEAEWEDIDDRLRDWGLAFRQSGVAGVWHHLQAAGLAARLLATADGERELSDLRHIGELLHARLEAQPSTEAALAGWLADQIAGAERDDVEAARRRLESDADAVAVLTIHAAKGLEFPIVLLPSLWEGPWTPEDDPPIFHDSAGNRCIGVGGTGDGYWADQVDQADLERDEEELRLLYVALTRARHRVVVWWATSKDSVASPFGRILLGHDPATVSVVRHLKRPPSEQEIRQGVAALTPADHAVIATEIATARLAAQLEPIPSAAVELAASRFDRTFDRRWTRTSYSSLTAAAYEAHQVTPDEADDTSSHDEPAVAAAANGSPGATPRPDQTPVPLGQVPGGARVGTLVHEILEATDFTTDDLEGAIAAAADRAGARRLLEGHVDVLVAGLALALRTPLGSQWEGLALTDLAPADRLDELAFDLPLAGGDTPHGVVTMDGVADVFAALPPDDPFAGYHHRLRDPLLAASVRGFLTGSIDLVARIGDRHLVVDYKTNILASAPGPLTLDHYRPDGLRHAMQDAHYPLQAALYVVALHRYLRWRVADYSPSRHLGGVCYLFLRGMAGPDSPLIDGEPYGVLAWNPPAGFVTGLSDVLDRGAP